MGEPLRGHITHTNRMATQDLPPPGGFGTINIDRVAPKPMLRHGILFGITIGVTIYGWCYFCEWKKRHRVLKTELNEHFIAANPFILAEQERKFLLRLWFMRENERDLMKDVPNWKVGTLYGEKLYKTLPPDCLPAVSVSEFTVHRPKMEWYTKVIVPTWYK